MDKQKILSSKTVFTAGLFEIKEEKVETDTDTFSYTTVYVEPAAAVIPINPKGEIYLINEYRHFFGKKVLGIIAGSIEKGETSLSAAKRELQEEGGMRAQQWELLVKVVPMRSIVKAETYIFLATDLEITKQALEEDEEIEVVKMPLKEAVAKVMNGEIFHSPSMTAILMLDKLKQQKRF